MSFEVKTKKPGDMIRSEDWNEAMKEISNLENRKFSLNGGAIDGSLIVNGKVESTNPAAFINGDLKIDGTTEISGKLLVDGPVVRKVWVATGLGPNDEKNDGLIDGRVLNFTKFFENTAVRIAYNDCFRVYNEAGGGSGRWEILVDNKAPGGGRIFSDFHDHTQGLSNHHRPSTILGFADGLVKGEHKITVRVRSVAGAENDHRNFYTGWNNARWTIEAEEVWVQE